MGKSKVKLKIGVIGLKGLPAYVGAGTVGENLIDQLKDDFDFYVYSTSSHTSLKSGKYNGFYQKVFKKIPFKRFNAFWYYLISALHARYRNNFDIIHVHNSYAAFIIGILKNKYPVILTTHGSFNIVDKWKKYAWFWKYNNAKHVKKADYLCCVSKYEKRKFKELFNLDARLIPNGINTVSKKDLPLIGINEPYIFFGSGRIIRSKGLHDLINALHKINFKGRLLVAGDINQIQSYKSEIMNLTGDLNITFLGLIKEKSLLLSYIGNATIFVYPSYVEAMSMMLLEAVSVDCPIICSDIIGNKDILDDKEALFFRTKDSDELAKKIYWALSNPEEMDKLAQNAKRRFLDEYNWENIAKQYKDIYIELKK